MTTASTAVVAGHLIDVVTGAVREQQVVVIDDGRVT